MPILKYKNMLRDCYTHVIPAVMESDSVYLLKCCISVQRLSI